MATIDLQRSHSLPLDEVKDRLKKLVDDFAERRKELVSKVEWSDDRSHATASGKGFKATFRVDEREARVAVDLSLMLRPFKKKVQARLEQKLEEALG